MSSFREILAEVCKRPQMYVGVDDFVGACVFLEGYDVAMSQLRPDLVGTGFRHFREWLAVRLDSCVRSPWPQLIVREDTGPDKFRALETLFDEFERDRSDPRTMDLILAKFLTLGLSRDRICWCELPPEERPNWRPGYRRP